VDWRASILDPPLQTEALPGIGGVLRARLEDFFVEEIPAYAPSAVASSGPERTTHAFFTLTKRGRSTHDAIAILAEHLGISPRDVGSAGRKDRDAVTVQWLSVPGSAAQRLPGFRHPDIELGPVTAHDHKLRMGHLHGNRFRIVIRSVVVPGVEAVARATSKLAAIAADGGLLNEYGPQRFGRGGQSLDRGIEAMRQGRAGARGNLIVAAGQAGLFNAWVALRRRENALRRVLLGDVLEKVATGGLFVCTDPGHDQARLEAAEIEITGPVFGSRMREAGEKTPAAALEQEALDLLGISRSALARLGRRAVGTRRSLRIQPTEARAEAIEGIDARAIGVEFVLPAGSYATRVCAELQGGAGVEPRRVEHDVGAPGAGARPPVTV
jgi:tRNA pseudouridine13 synthase